MSEKELVARAKSGDFEAFSELIDAHKSKIYALVRKLTGNVQDAEDIVQETFLKAIDKIDQFRGESSFGTWLYTIALNLTRAQYAKQKQAELRPLEEYLPGGGSSADNHNAGPALFDWRDPHKILESNQLREIIDNVLNELPYKYREAFILRYFQELSVKEVAGIIKESEAATKSRILRARMALRERLTEVFEDSYGEELPRIRK
jgi:RNA polymerase sigma-70 factor (ECF subfamily)